MLVSGQGGQFVTDAGVGPFFFGFFFCIYCQFFCCLIILGIWVLAFRCPNVSWRGKDNFDELGGGGAGLESLTWWLDRVYYNNIVCIV